MKPEPRGTTCRTCGKQDHNAKACKGGKPKPKAVSAIKTAVQEAVQAALSAQTAQNAETASFAFNNFALHHNNPGEKTPSSKQDPKLGPGEDLNPWVLQPHRSSSPATGGQVQQQHACQGPHAAHGVRPHPRQLGGELTQVVSNPPCGRPAPRPDLCAEGRVGHFGGHVGPGWVAGASEGLFDPSRSLASIKDILQDTVCRGFGDCRSYWRSSCRDSRGYLLAGITRSSEGDPEPVHQL